MDSCLLEFLLLRVDRRLVDGRLEFGGVELSDCETCTVSTGERLDHIQIATTPVPAPPVVWLLGFGLAGLVLATRRKRS